MSIKESGTVRWFSDKKGYGFLTMKDGEDLFVHYSAIEMQGYKTLKANDEVEFEIVDGDKGKQAANVTTVGAELESE